MDKHKAKNQTRDRRRGRIRAKVTGTKERPRLSVFRSNVGMFLQVINDETGKTIFSVDSREIKEKCNKTENAFKLGKLVAERAGENKISTIVFDRGGYKFHGRVKAVADGAREAGLKF